jgi:hypothetical protein
VFGSSWELICSWSCSVRSTSEEDARDGGELDRTWSAAIQEDGVGCL